jgi:hypothetical protein
MKKLMLLLPVLMVTTLASATVTAYSPPVGGMTITVPAGQTRSWSIPLLHGSVGAGATVGRIETVGTNFITDSSAGWTAGAFSTTANPYYLRIKTGASAGRVLLVNTASANTATQMNLKNDGTDLTQAGIATGVNGDIYELVLADTLSSLFGSTTLQGGPNSSTADVVQVWSGTAWQLFYYNTTDLRWELSTDTSASPSRDNFVLRPDRGILIARRAATALTMYVNGRVPDATPRYFQSRPGVTFLSNGLPVGITLGTLSMQTIAPGWIAGSDPTTATSTADTIQVWSGTAWFVFYYDSVNNRWQLNTDTGASPTRNTFNIPAGRPIMVRRLTAGATLFDGVVPIALPYTINL